MPDGAASVACGALSGRYFVVTAGPTREAIDPVRYLSNHSTGQMGYAIAAELAARGARVTLVSGPTALQPPAGVDFVAVESAEQMRNATVRAWNGSADSAVSGDGAGAPANGVGAPADGAVLCAAVADYAPAEVSAVKIKKLGNEITLRLRRTPDIAAELGATKGGRLLVGFALETDNEEANAREKLVRKNMDMIVLNSLADSGAGFGFATNKVTILGRDGSRRAHPLAPKTAVAALIVDAMEKAFINSVN